MPSKQNSIFMNQIWTYFVIFYFVVFWNIFSGIHIIDEFIEKESHTWHNWFRWNLGIYNWIFNLPLFSHSLKYIQTYRFTSFHISTFYQFLVLFWQLVTKFYLSKPIPIFIWPKQHFEICKQQEILFFLSIDLLL